MKPKTRPHVSLGILMAALVIAGVPPVAGSDQAGVVQPFSAFPTEETARPTTDSFGPPAVVLHNATPELVERVDAALARFAEANLDLPPLDITFHDDVGGCDGHRGLYRSVSGIADVEVCTPTVHIILHELAHAWVPDALDVLKREAVLDYWGLEIWNDQDVSWDLRGNEKAADTIAFALGHIPTDPRPSLIKYLCGYSLLTDQAVPGVDDGFHHRCDGRATSGWRASRGALGR